MPIRVIRAGVACQTVIGSISTYDTPAIAQMRDFGVSLEIREREHGLKSTQFIILLSVKVFIKNNY